MRSVITIVLVLFVCGCATVSFKTTTDKPLAYTPLTSLSLTGQQANKLAVGLERVLLTPPPGYPMTGYSIAGRYGRGKWNEQYATALCIIDKDGTPFVLVCTDLWGIPEGLKHRVTYLLSQHNETRMLGKEDVLLTAIHDHHALGPYVPDNAYALGSPGFAFDEAAINFAATRIAASIVNATKDALDPTHLGKRNLHAYRNSVSGIARNRSQAAFKRNPSKEQALGLLNEDLTVFVVTQDSIIGALCHYAVHPTATGDATEVYSSDIFGVARDYCENEFSSSGSSRVIVGFLNGAEGDVAPNYNNLHSRSEAARIGTLLGKSIKDAITLAATQSPITGKVEHRVERMEIACQEVQLNTSDVDCYCRIPSTPLVTAHEGMVGAGALGGASDGRTMLYNLGLREGIRRDYVCDEEHGIKQPAAAFALDSVLAFGLNKSLSPILAGMISTKPKKQTDISIHTVGPLTFIGVPGEFTTTLGRRITHGVQEVLGATSTMPTICGLADDYVSYVTTPCEYSEQSYEGASTYFGPSMGQLFVDKFRALAQRSPIRMQDREGYTSCFDAGQTETFGAGILERHRSWQPNIGLANMLNDSVGNEPRTKTLDMADENTEYKFTRGSAADTIKTLRITFRDDVKAIPHNGGDVTATYYPTVEIKHLGAPKTRIETILCVDNCTLPEAQWSLFIPDITTLSKGIYKITVRRQADGLAGEFTLRIE